MFNLKKSLLGFGFNELKIDEWLKITKTRNAVINDFSYNSFISQIEGSGAKKTTF